MSDDLQELYQEIILDHNKRPRNYGKLDPHSHEAEGHNPLCGDQLELYLRMQDDTVEDVRFEAAGCAISKAAASIMTEHLMGKSREEVDEAFDRISRILSGEIDADPETDGELMALAGVRKFPARIKCASLPWHTVKAAMDGTGKAVTE